MPLLQQVKDLKEKRGRAATNGRALLEQASAEGVDEARAAELETQHDAAMSDYDDCDRQIQRLERQIEIDRRENERDEAETRSRRPHPGSARQERSNEDGAPTYAEVFKRAIQFGAGDLAPEERQILMAGRDADPEARALATGSGSTGGYLIPQDMLPEIERALADYSPMMDENVCRHMVTASGSTITAPTLDYTSIRGELKAEGAATTDDGTSDPAFGQKDLSAYVYRSGIIKVSLEQVQDSHWNMEELIADLFGESLGATCNAVLTNGDGLNKPQGIAAFAGTGKTAAAEAAIDPDEIIDLVHSVPAAYRKNPSARFQLNDTTLASVRKLKDGQDNYLWQQADIRAGEPAQLLGFGYEVNPDMDDIEESASPIIFGAHNKFIVRKVGMPGVIVFREQFMGNLQLGFMAYRRIDGAGMQPKALKKLTMKAAA
jgi:HK97 family phage major capsid protein